MTEPPADVVLLNGVVGAGKSTTAEALSALLGDRGVPHVVLETDELRRFWPASAGDPFNQRLALTNVTAVARNARDAGARRLIVAGVVASARERERHRIALDAHDLLVVRLTAAPDLVDARLRRRHEGHAAELAWHLARRSELERVLDEARIDDLVLDTSELTPLSAADAVGRAAGWWP